MIIILVVYMQTSSIFICLVLTLFAVSINLLQFCCQGLGLTLLNTEVSFTVGERCTHYMGFQGLSSSVNFAVFLKILPLSVDSDDFEDPTFYFLFCEENFRTFVTLHRQMSKNYIRFMYHGQCVIYVDSSVSLLVLLLLFF